MLCGKAEKGREAERRGQCRPAAEHPDPGPVSSSRALSAFARIHVSDGRHAT
jgi:hypothetical protein